MIKKQIVTSLLLIVALIAFTGCTQEPVTTTVTQTQTASVTSNVTSFITTTSVVNTTVTTTITKTAQTSTSQSTSSSQTSSRSTSTTVQTSLGTITSEDGKYVIEPTIISQQYGGVMIAGVVKNLSTEKASILITLTCYDIYGDALGTASSTSYFVEAGSQGTFKINLTIVWDNIYSYSLTAQRA